MLVNKNELQRALEIVKPGLANKELIEQSTSFAFVGGKVITYNDEISISHPITGLDIEGAVKADKLYSLLGKIKKDEIELSIENNEIIISSGRSRAGLTIQHEIKLPLEEELNQRGKWKSLPEKFLHFIEFAVSSCTKSMADPVLTAVHVNKQGFIEASDSYRVTRCELGEDMPIDTFLIPAEAVMDMLRLQPVKITDGQGWVHFKTEEGTVISCRTMDDTFPDTTPVLKVKGTRILLPKNINNALERANIFAKRKVALEESINISLSAGKMKVRAESDADWFEETMKIEYKGEELDFSITPYLLKNILAETGECELSERKIKFQGEGWIYVAMLRHQ
jgi:DNA polymerase III sliding clamp (beta) subunit (PCNA family)